MNLKSSILKIGVVIALICMLVPVIAAEDVDDSVYAENVDEGTDAVSEGISVTDELAVDEDDAGDDDYTMEKVKAEASDSFKRAGFAWGIGRSLYTAPKIKITDQFKDSQFFDVEEIEYDQNNRISKLVISTNFGKDIVFSYPRTRNVAQNGYNEPKTDNEEPRYTIEKKTLKQIQDFIANSNEESKDRFYKWLNKFYGTMNPETLTKTQGEMVLQTLLGK